MIKNKNTSQRLVRLGRKKIHFIGIAGAGMSALAVMLKKMGHEVTGSDEDFYDPIASYLKKNKIKILTPYGKKNIPEDTDMIVIGKHAKLDPAHNKEVEYALKQKEKVKTFPEVLSEITEDRENIVVAGSYGKSTSTALLAWCLEQNDIDAGYFIGGIVNGLTDSAHLGTHKYFVLEGDEYPAFEGVSKFLYLHPKYVLLTSAEHDHVNVFKTEKSYVEPYKKLAALLPKDGLLVAGINNPNVKEVAADSKAKVVTYGVEDAQWHAKNIKYDKETSFDLYHNEEKVVELSTTLLGRHNIENIVGVSAFLLEKNIIDKEGLKKAVATFKGLKRRIDLLTDKSSVLVYEGFGSSYSKAKSVFETLKLHFPDKKLITIFEPHTFGWRNKENKKWYQDIFDTSSQVLLLPPGAHGAATHDQMTFDEIYDEVKKNHKGEIQKIGNEEQALDILKKIVQKDDIVALISSGPLLGLAESVPKLMEKMFPRHSGKSNS